MIQCEICSERTFCSATFCDRNENKILSKLVKTLIEVYYDDIINRSTYILIDIESSIRTINLLKNMLLNIRDLDGKYIYDDSIFVAIK